MKLKFACADFTFPLLPHITPATHRHAGNRRGGHRPLQRTMPRCLAWLNALIGTATRQVMLKS